MALSRKVIVLGILVLLMISLTVYVMGYVKKPNPVGSYEVWKAVMHISPEKAKSGEQIEIKVALQLVYPNSYCVNQSAITSNYLVYISVVDSNGKQYLSKYFEPNVSGLKTVCVIMNAGDELTLVSTQIILVNVDTYTVKAKINTKYGSVELQSNIQIV
ncbi:MAG: hypothetical protein RQ952_06630 [Thermoproteota archaeon]|nr:hypothetical protein [Thermoproteota archaeon]